MNGRSVMLGAPVASPPPQPPWPGAGDIIGAPAECATPAWSRPAQWSAGLLVALALALLAYHAALGQRWASRPSALEPNALRAASLDLNRADQADLLQLPGVGEGLARRILERRDQLGGFRSVDDLRSVRGIGPATLEQLRAFVHVVPYDEEEEGGPSAPPFAGPVSASGPAPPGKAAARRTSGKKVPPASPLDLNRASAAELERHLEGIGPAKAKSIVEARAQRPFASVEDLCRVKGIKAKTLERIRPHIAVGGPARK
jgi:competence protein ComEA